MIYWRTVQEQYARRVIERVSPDPVRDGKTLTTYHIIEDDGSLTGIYWDGKEAKIAQWWLVETVRLNELINRNFATAICPVV